MKLEIEYIVHNELESHPAGVRGLKHRMDIAHTIQILSHPAGVRGLKLVS